MEYRKFGETIVLRLEVGEEVVESLCALAEREHIGLACVTGIGAADHICVGVLDIATKQYNCRDYRGYFEIGNLSGNLTRKEGAPYAHLHITFGSPVADICMTGHLTRAVISATAELFVTVLPGEVGRRMEEQVGLNLFSFSDEGETGHENLRHF